MSELFLKFQSFLADDDIISYKQALVQKNLMSPVDLKKEQYMFTLFCLGFPLKAIARKFNIPHSVTIHSAMFYDWWSKRGLLGKDTEDQVSTDITKEIATNLHAALLIQSERALQHVLNGEDDSTGLVPKTIAEAKVLLEATDSIKKTGIFPSKQNSTNVQVNVAQVPMQIGGESIDKEKFKNLPVKERLQLLQKKSNES